MTKIIKFDKPTLRNLRDDINLALASVADDYGIKLSAGNASFMADNVSFKLQGTIIGDDGVAKTQERIDLETFHSSLVDLPITLSNGAKGKVVGYSRRSRKYPFLVDTNKGTFKLTQDQVERHSKGQV